ALGLNRWCLRSWKNDTYPGLLLEIKDSFGLAKVMDSTLPVEKWPIHNFPLENIQRCLFDKCDSIDELILSLKTKKILREPVIEKAFRKIDRQWFCRENPY